MQVLCQELLEQARAMGFGSLWVTDVRRFNAWKQAIQSRGDGYGASLEADPLAIMPSAKRIVVLAYPYGDLPEADFPLVRISPYYLASQSAYHGATALAHWLEARGWPTLAHPMLPQKPAALRAGVGRYGRNGLIHTMDFGSRVVLAMLLTDAELPLSAQDADPQAPNALLDPTCEGCDRCMCACPTGALDGSSAVDTARCLRAFMFYDKPVPPEYRPLMGNRLLGCDLCQQACPHNACTVHRQPPQNAPSIRLDALLGEPKTQAQALKALADAVGPNYARTQKVLAQAALLAGNSGDLGYIDALLSHCQSENPVLRAHAQWAVERLRGIED